MIRWSFWVDPWEHPFNIWSRNTPTAFVEPLPVEIAADLPTIPEMPKPVIPIPSREWSAYELAVIGYYNRYGYVEAAADKAIIADYVNSSRQESIAPSPEHTSVDDPRWQEDEYTHVAPYSLRIGPYTDETVPQIVKYI